LKEAISDVHMSIAFKHRQFIRFHVQISNTARPRWWTYIESTLCVSPVSSPNPNNRRSRDMQCN